MEAKPPRTQAQCRHGSLLAAWREVAAGSGRWGGGGRIPADPRQQQAHQLEWRELVAGSGRWAAAAGSWRIHGDSERIHGNDKRIRFVGGCSRRRGRRFVAFAGEGKADPAVGAGIGSEGAGARAGVPRGERAAGAPYFNPDEHWQCLEVAHRVAFGYHLTWEWKRGLRGYLHPLTFAALYKILALLHLDTPWFMVMAPHLLQ